MAICSVGNHEMYGNQIAPLVSRLPRMRRCRMNNSWWPQTPFLSVASSPTPLFRLVFSRRFALLRSDVHILCSPLRVQRAGRNPGQRLAASGLFPMRLTVMWKGELCAGTLRWCHQALFMCFKTEGHVLFCTEGWLMIFTHHYSPSAAGCLFFVCRNFVESSIESGF